MEAFERRIKASLTRDIQRFNRKKRSGRRIPSKRACARSPQSRCSPARRVRCALPAGVKAVKMLWSSWKYDAQHLACAIADDLSRGAHRATAIEQSHFPMTFLERYGTWDEEVGTLDARAKQEGVTATRAQLEALRKRLWDFLSRKWAEHPVRHVIVVLPVPRAFDAQSTLRTIELPRLFPASRVCLLEYDCRRHLVTVLRRDATQRVSQIELEADDFVPKRDAIKAVDAWMAPKRASSKRR